MLLYQMLKPSANPSDIKSEFMHISRINIIKKIYKRNSLSFIISVLDFFISYALIILHMMKFRLTKYENIV